MFNVETEKVYFFVWSHWTLGHLISCQVDDFHSESNHRHFAKLLYQLQESLRVTQCSFNHHQFDKKSRKTSRKVNFHQAYHLQGEKWKHGIPLISFGRCLYKRCLPKTHKIINRHPKFKSPTICVQWTDKHFATKIRKP